MFEDFGRVWSDMWKSCERYSMIIFYVPLMCCEYRDALLLTIFQLIHQDMVSYNSVFTGSKDALCIQPSELDLSVYYNICEPFPSFCIVMYIDSVRARNSNRFSVSFMCHSGGIFCYHANQFLL